MTKSEIRKLSKLRRNGMDKEDLSNRAAEAFLITDIYRSSGTIMLYMPIGSEADTSRIMRKALSDGKKVVIPVTSADGVITPAHIREETTYIKGAFCIPEPATGKTVPPDDIDVVIVPGLAFDKAGGRVGYGKGCYDRFLPLTNAVRIGYSFEELVWDEINTDSRDASMDYLLTESGLSRCI